MNVLEIYDENGDLVSYMTEEGVITGDDIEVTGTDEVIEAEIVTPATEPVVYLYTESNKWDKIKINDGEWIPLNGVYTSDSVPFDFKLKDSETSNESGVYHVVGTGKFFIHDDGSWEKIGEVSVVVPKEPTAEAEHEIKFICPDSFDGDYAVRTDSDLIIGPTPIPDDAIITIPNVDLDKNGPYYLDLLRNNNNFTLKFTKCGTFDGRVSDLPDGVELVDSKIVGPGVITPGAGNMTPADNYTDCPSCGQHTFDTNTGVCSNCMHTERPRM